jgi:ABC-type lipoprotein release transport system permease subunit
MLLLKLAWRNLFRNVRRTLLTVMLVGFSLVALILTDGIMIGIQESMVGTITQTLAGEAQIHRRGFLDDMDEALFIADPEPIIELVEANEAIAAYAPRVLSAGMISSSYNIAGGLVYGVDADREISVSKIKQAIIEGEYLSGSPRQILLGMPMAELLEVSLGDRIVVTVSEVETGEIGQELFRLSGILEFGVPEIDEGLVFINLGVAQRVIGLDEGVHEIAVRFKNPKDAKNRNHAFYSEVNDDDIEALSWLDLSSAISSFIEIADYGTLIIGIVLFLLAALGLINSLFMSIYERIYEFGVAKAIGTTPRGIVGLVMLESFLIALVSCAIGSILGYYVNSWFEANGIPMGTFEVEGVVLQGVYTKVVIEQFVTLPFYVVLLVLVAAIYPAMFASRIVPATALQRSL